MKGGLTSVQLTWIHAVELFVIPPNKERITMGNILTLLLGIGAIVLGLKGFSEKGLPWSKDKSITGTPAKAIGIICILFGALCFLLVGLVFLVVAGLLPPIKEWF
jgi:hypothetical protein